MDRFKPDSEPPLWPMCLLFIRSTFPLMNVAATSAIRAEKGHWKCGKHRCHPNGRMYFGHHPHHPPPLRAGQGGSSRTLALKAGSPQPRWRFNAPKLSARTGRPPQALSPSRGPGRPSGAAWAGGARCPPRRLPLWKSGGCGLRRGAGDGGPPLGRQAGPRRPRLAQSQGRQPLPAPPARPLRPGATRRAQARVPSGSP